MMPFSIEVTHTTRLCCRCLCLYAAVTVLAVGHPSASAQDAGDQPLDPSWQFGFDAFQLMLEHQGMRTTDDFAGTLRDDPSRSAIVMVGDFSRMPEWTWPQISTYIRRGGAVLIATDRATDIPGICVMAEGPVMTVSRRDAYRNYPDCPILRNIEDQHTLMRGVKELILNRAGWVDRIGRQQGHWSMLAWLPRSVSNAVTNRGAGKPLAAAMTLPGGNPGRLLAVGDHSLFINAMLWHGDNAAFAHNVSRWLAKGGRNRVLFLSGGVPMLPGTDPQEHPGNMDINPEDLPDLPKESWLAFANNFVSGLEDNDVFNQLAMQWPKEMPRAEYWNTVLLSLALLAGWMLLRRFPANGRSIENPIRREAASLLATRVQEQVQSQDLKPVATELARELFRDLCGTGDPRIWSIDALDVEVEGSFWFRRKIRSSLQRFAKLARKSDRRSVSQKELKKLVYRIQQIRMLHRHGRLSHPWFTPPDHRAELSSAVRENSSVWLGASEGLSS